METLDEIIKKSITAVLSSDAVADAAKKAANDAVLEVINSAFGYNSEFRKNLKSVIGQILPTVQVNDLAKFTNAVRVVLENRLKNIASDTVKDNLGKVIDSLLPESNVITLDELRRAYRDKIMNHAMIANRDFEKPEDEDEDSLDFCWRIEGAKDKYWDLWASPDPDANRYSGKDVITLRFRPCHDQDGLQECWHACVGRDGNLVGSLFCGPIYGFDAMVFRLAAGIAKLKI